MLNKLSFSLFKKIPVVLQTESAECGLACLAMVAGYYGGESNLFQLRSKYGLSSKGATLRNLIDIASDLKSDYPSAFSWAWWAKNVTATVYFTLGF